MRTITSFAIAIFITITITFATAAPASAFGGTIDLGKGVALKLRLVEGGYVFDAGIKSSGDPDSGFCKFWKRSTTPSVPWAGGVWNPLSLFRGAVECSGEVAPDAE